MVGLMLKDFYESFCIKKNLIGFICSILLYGMVFFLMPFSCINDTNDKCIAITILD